MKLNNKPYSQRGLSLVELMISITLGLILLTGVMQVFLSSKNVYTSQQALSRVQETGRLAIDFIARDIRMAGYTGCASRAPDMKFTNTLENKTQYSYNFEEAIRGYTAETLPVTTPVTLSPVARANTDLIVIRSAVGSGVEVIENNTDEHVRIRVPTGSVEVNACPSGNGDRVNGFCKGDILFVSDCSKTLVFQATAVDATTGNIAHVAKADSTVVPGNNVATWGGAGGADEHKFGLDAEVLTASTTTFYLASSAVDTAGTGIPSLWQKVNGVTTELLEGVENMSITYGEDTSTPADLLPDVYRAAGSVVDWGRVSSVRVELVVATLANNTVPETQKYFFKGVTQTPTDLRLRQVFTTTIGIRSRSF
jgi:type IV pilus assembly protein PilW